MGIMEVLLFAGGAVLGTAFAWLMFRVRIASAEIALREEQTRSLDEMQAKLSEVSVQAAQLGERASRLPEIESERELLRARTEELLKQLQESASKSAALQTALESERSQTEEKIKLLSEARETLSNQFKSLANEILEEKSKKFTDQNKENLTQLLDPLKTKLGDFQKKVEEVYVDEAKGRSSLSEQLNQLRQLNQRLSEDANNLTRALKGDSKTQGNWGELILERLLEESGLSKDLFYSAQESHTREDGSRVQPDVIIRLPEDRYFVVDSKVSLLAFEEYCRAESEEAREELGRRHLASVRSHIKGLRSKNYQELHKLKSLDCVLMFVPIEPAFMVAIARDKDLWTEAWKQDVLLVSPSTFLFVVRMINQLWRQDQQTRKVNEVMKAGELLYDKFAGFVEDLQKVGRSLGNAQVSYDAAFSKLKTGPGNLITRVEKLKTLGVHPKKQLDANLVSEALDEPLLLDEGEESPKDPLAVLVIENEPS